MYINEFFRIAGNLKHSDIYVYNVTLLGDFQ